MAGVGEQQAKENYRTDDYEKFFESLVYICGMENVQYINHEWNDPDEYKQTIMSNV